MRWKEVQEGYQFKDGSYVTQKHQKHTYDCYEITYGGKTIVLSKDHLLKVNITKLPSDAQKEIKQFCTGQIPLAEDVEVYIGQQVTSEQMNTIKKFINGEDVDIKVDEIHYDTEECYRFYFDEQTVDIFVYRYPVKYESQKIDDYHYWVSVEGLAYLFCKYGEIEI